MNVDKLNAKKLLLKNRLIVDIDLAKNNHRATLMLPDGSAHRKPLAITQDRPGFDKLWDSAVACARDINAAGIVFGFESTGSYWEPLAQFISQRRAEFDIPVDVVFVPCRVVKATRVAMDLSRTKNDNKDSYIVAQVVSEGKFSPVRQLTDHWAHLRRLCQRRETVLATTIEANNHLAAIQHLYWPERDTVLKDLLADASVSLLEHHPFPQDIIALGLDELALFLKASSNRRFGRKKAAELLAAARSSVGIRHGLETARLEVRHYVNLVRLSQQHLEELERALLEAAGHTGLLPLLTSIRGIGPITAALLLAEMGDPRDFANSKELVKLAGLNLVQDQSGQRPGHHKVISKIGRSLFRTLLYRTAGTVIRHNPAIRSLYLTRRCAGSSHRATMVRCMDKILRTIHAICRTGELFNQTHDAEVLSRLEVEFETLRSKKVGVTKPERVASAR